MGKQWKQWQTLFSWAPKSCSLEKKSTTNLESILKSRDFANKALSSQSYGFSSSYVWIWELDHKEGWVLKNWCFQTVLLEKTFEILLDCKEIKPVNSTENQSWIFIGKTDAEASILWPSDVKNWLTGKDLDSGKGWRQEEKGMTEEEMVGWHHWLDGHEFEQAPGVGDRQGRLACYSPCGRKESDKTDWTKLMSIKYTLDFIQKVKCFCNVICKDYRLK